METQAGGGLLAAELRLLHSMVNRTESVVTYREDAG
jgi:hypothetical protein